MQSLTVTMESNKVSMNIIIFNVDNISMSHLVVAQFTLLPIHAHTIIFAALVKIGQQLRELEQCNAKKTLVYFKYRLEYLFMIFQICH